MTFIFCVACRLHATLTEDNRCMHCGSDYTSEVVEEKRRLLGNIKASQLNRIARETAIRREHATNNHHRAAVESLSKQGR